MDVQILGGFMLKATHTALYMDDICQSHCISYNIQGLEFIIEVNIFTWYTHMTYIITHIILCIYKIVHTIFKLPTLHLTPFSKKNKCSEICKISNVGSNFKVIRVFNKQGVAKEKGLAKNNESIMMID